MQDKNNNIEMTEATMVGALMQCVVEQCKVLPKPWQALSEADQRDYLYRVETQVRAAVKQAVFLLHAQDCVTIPATVSKVVFKDGVKAELELTPGAPGRHDLADAEGNVVHILIVDNTALDSSEGKPQPEKDQPDLPLDDPEGGGDDEDNGGGGAAVALEDRTVKTLAELSPVHKAGIIKQATDVVIEYQVASMSLLQTQLGVTAGVAGELLAVLAELGVVSKPNHEGLRAVLAVDGDAAQQPAAEEFEAPAFEEVEPEPEAGETSKGRRLCGCVIAHGDEHLQRCPGFEWDNVGIVSRDCKHCQHDEDCHEWHPPADEPPAKPRRRSRKSGGQEAGSDG